MAKNSQFAEEMSPELIRDVLKEQRDEADVAIERVHNTLDSNIQRRLDRLTGKKTHEPIAPSGTSKTFEELRKSLNSVSSAQDLKDVVADRRSSKITPDQHRRYLGLLNRAVQKMVKDPKVAEMMTSDLIKDILKEQRHGVEVATEMMHKTQTDNMQRRLHRLTGRVTHEPIMPSGKSKSFEDLRKQLQGTPSLQSLKDAVADRRSSKITPDQHRRYLGLLNRAVQNMVKKPEIAEVMTSDLIKDVLKEQRHGAEVATEIMHKTQAANVQRRLDNLKKE